MVPGKIAGLPGTSAVAATLPSLIAQWQLSSTQAGWLSGAYFVGYALTVPFLVSLTDRIDSRFVFALGSLLGAAGWSASPGARSDRSPSAWP